MLGHHDATRDAYGHVQVDCVAQPGDDFMLVVVTLQPENLRARAIGA